MIAASGVRSSWLMRERNSFLAVPAVRRRAFASCSSLERRTRSASIPAARSCSSAAVAAWTPPCSRRWMNSVTSITRWIR